VGGHTHNAVAHRVNGIPSVVSWGNGRAFGRIDLSVDPATKRVVASRVLPPQDICGRFYEGTAGCDRAPEPNRALVAASYEGRGVVADPRITRVMAPAVERAARKRLEPLGVRVASPVRRAYASESALGNLAVDLMRAGRPDADVAILNGGGLRADLDPGELTFGRLFEVYPFDNRLATLRASGAGLARVIAANLQGERSVLLVSGLRARARCEDEQLVVLLEREDGRPVGDQEELSVVTTDFLTGGGDSLFGALGPQLSAKEDPTLVRDLLVEQLRRRGGELRGEDIFDPQKPRLLIPSPRPVRCGSTATAAR
jgi:5'-nucleotidase